MPLSGEYEPSKSKFFLRGEMIVVADQVELYEKSGGAEGAFTRGSPTVVMTSRGAKSGKLRKTPLARIEHDGEYAIVGTHRGATKNPDWCYNLLADPHVVLQDRATIRDMIAREVTGDEKALWWDRALQIIPSITEYKKKAGREIPVFVLTPEAPTAQ
ncbi:nitroreductase [Rhodococcus sp. WMMA185]|uniref:nitroreductase family deazaflavin-dependent oxidoreductase n=1 Tax=Rhodococcus sp. WMMA185 TaxID=679318 RepID=UPI000878FC3C|nr:nitroreductase family deazaflavin-dependent oxidoreductase [Rhodococcus sp. WMMA185]AOW92566.1 nitroreductase [Rhodococcus sp. WMMA185]